MAALPETIKALQIQENKTVGVIDLPFASQEKVRNLPEDEVILRVRAVGLNPTDWKHAIGTWGSPNTIAGCDAAGDVVKVGSAVKHLKVGDRAAGFTTSVHADNGAYAQYVRYKAAVTFKFPEGVTYEEAASFPIPHLTAVQALYLRLGIPKPFSAAAPLKENILIWGGSTAVGHHAVQLAALSGLTVFVTASPAAHEGLKALGATHVFDYKDKDIVSKIHAAAGDKGISLGFDTVAENGTSEAIVDALSRERGGRVISLLPVADEVKTRRKDVDIEFTLVYTLLGNALTFAHAINLDVVPGDNAGALEWVSADLPRLLDGWKAGEGAPRYKAQRLRKLEGGLDRIIEGLKILSEGAYGREKLVYNKL